MRLGFVFIVVFVFKRGSAQRLKVDIEICIRFEFFSLAGISVCGCGGLFFGLAGSGGFLIGRGNGFSRLSFD